MKYEELVTSLQHVGKDPSRLIFEDELTGLSNRRFLLNFFDQRIQWDAIEHEPVSLLMMDVDYFKQINDSHGHSSGDQALMFLGRVLKEVAEDRGIPIRYAGDEFMILMPGGQKADALELSEHLMARIHAEPLQLEDTDTKLHLTLSIGVATAPEDAHSGKALIQKADTALYHAKKSGRDRVANATEIALKEVAGKAALQLLESQTISSRGAQLAEVADVIAKFDAGDSQMVLVEGTSGMGKTTFLTGVRRHLKDGEGYLVRGTGSVQEQYRPYYMITSVLGTLLDQKEDKGAAAFQSLTSKEVNYMAHVLPQLQAQIELRIAETIESEKSKREGIFNALLKFVLLVLDSQPLMILLDDLRYADEASLAMFQQLLGNGRVPVFLCGTSSVLESKEPEDQSCPLARFLDEQRDMLPLTRITLKPLTADDIGDFLGVLFPGLAAPSDFEQKLAELTQGNPLFLNEILRKLILDQKLTLEGQSWGIEPLEEGYLPKSLEEIVSQKISTLDEEGQRLLAQASTFGEDVSLSFLTGSSQAMEARVLEFIDQAAAIGLLSSDFQLNDETIRFVGKKVLEIAYSGIGEDRKQELHEKVGRYQEKLYQKRLMPSPAKLAWHFKRGNDKEKAKRYEEITAAAGLDLFNAQEATKYRLPEGAEANMGPPLDPAGLSHVPTVIRALQTAVRNIKFFPPGSQNVVVAVQEFGRALKKVLVSNERLNIIRVKQAFLINGQQVIDISEYKFVAAGFIQFLESLQLQGMLFLQGILEDEIYGLLDGLARTRPAQIKPGYWQDFLASQGSAHIGLKQMRMSVRRATAAAAILNAQGADPGDSTSGLALQDVVPEKTLGESPARGGAHEEAGDGLTAPWQEMDLVEDSPVPEAAVAEPWRENMPGESIERLLEGLPHRVQGLLSKRDTAAVRDIFEAVSRALTSKDQAGRPRVLEAIRGVLREVALEFQPELGRQWADPLLAAFDAELDPVSWTTLAEILRDAAVALIPLHEKAVAGRVLENLGRRVRQLEAQKDPRWQAVVAVVEKPLDPEIEASLLQDLRSGPQDQQQEAANVLRGLGMVSAPLLIRLLKEEGEPAVRALAAGVLAEQGVRAVKAFKRELGGRLPPTERARLLDVSDTVTRAVRTEVAYAMGDADPSVRQAAARVVERLNDRQLNQVLLPYVEHEDVRVATDAIGCLVNLNVPGLCDRLVSVLESSAEPVRLIACCQALGQIGGSAALDALAGVVMPKGFLFFRKRWHPDVRVAAVQALGRIKDPLASHLLASVSRDKDPRVRQLARASSKK